MLGAQATFLRLFPTVVYAAESPPLLSIELLLDTLWSDYDLSLLGSLVVFEFDALASLHSAVVLYLLMVRGVWNGRRLCGGSWGKRHVRR